MKIFDGKAFKRARKAAGFESINALAVAMTDEGEPITRATIQQWESRSAAPRSDLLVFACELMRCDPRELFRDKSSRKKRHADASGAVVGAY